MNFLRKLDNHTFTALVSEIVSLLAFAASSFLIPTSNFDIPFGFMFSGGVVAIVYLLSSFLIKLDEKKESAVWSIVSIILRLVVFAAVTIILCFMTYVWGVKVLNVFTFIGLYTFSTVVFTFSHAFRNIGKE
jgi:hypothetical protein